ncbi:hypothetical protein COLO4_14980 [Corchorus olitorius]|uniref:Uncharacterized protein n=1 Tax=Corchorus olitorius TaxID=93759 RepID=A0A1R3JPV9_9ROSI|nr:hypothetical protein COLO4_14980 [Corchorus olitorius]
MAAPKVTLKLLIDTKNNRALFAEAGKGFVDFLVNMMLLPNQSSDQSPVPVPMNAAYGFYGGTNPIQRQPPSGTRKNYKCSYCNKHVGGYMDAIKSCFSCGVGTLVALDDKKKSSGHVRGFTYSIMDDLAALKLLKTSMLSKTVLTDVFLRNNANKTTRNEDADDFVKLKIDFYQAENFFHMPGR